MPRTALRFLLDTNVFISAEPAGSSEAEELTRSTSSLIGRCSEAGLALYLHPDTAADLSRDRNRSRSTLRLDLLQKYPLLPDPPVPPPSLAFRFGNPAPGSNNWVDLRLLSAVHGNAVHFLVTEDRAIHRHAHATGMGQRVLFVSDALAMVEELVPKRRLPPPAVRACFAHSIDRADPILDTFRIDYPSFDDWFARCQLEHRHAWSVSGSRGSIAAFCIVKHETNAPSSVTGKVLKLCSFKVSHQYGGLRLGELLLKSIFDFAFDQLYDHIFVTVFAKHTRLVDLFLDFGFTALSESTALGELILVKPLRPRGGAVLGDDPLRSHIAYGPRWIAPNAHWFLVPVQPRFSNTLFPETTTQGHLFPGTRPCGNALRKAYLCHSPVRSIPAGSAVAFYRSGPGAGLIAAGVVESTFRSNDPSQIASLVGARTVYSLEEIEGLCSRSVLSVLFRQVVTLHQPLTLASLVKNQVALRAPQSIARIRPSGVPWLRTIFQL